MSDQRFIDVDVTYCSKQCKKRKLIQVNSLFDRKNKNRRNFVEKSMPMLMPQNVPCFKDMAKHINKNWKPLKDTFLKKVKSSNDNFIVGYYIIWDGDDYSRYFILALMHDKEFYNTFYGK